MKTVVVINGAGGVGKDTLCNIIAKKYKCSNESSIIPIKEIATKYGGWNGEKDAKSRKFLSDLKLLFSEYNNLPFNYLLTKVDIFNSYQNTEVLFVHIREPDEIEKFIKAVRDMGIRCVSLLITRENSETWGNKADDNVNNYNYDYYYHNCLSLEETHKAFTTFFENVILGQV